MSLVKTGLLCLLIATALQTIILTSVPKALAQGNSLQNNVNLNGMWQREDGNVVYITHTFNQVISSFDPEGYCDVPGMENVQTTLDFSARIEGNQLIGEKNLCDPNINVNDVTLHPLQLIIRNDGNQLSGTYGDGGVSTASYIRLSNPQETPITSLPSKVWKFTGWYLDDPNTDKLLTPVAAGTYAANYLNTSGINPTLFFIALGGTFAAIIGAGSYAAVKKAHTKHSKSQEKNSDKQEEQQKLHVIRLAIEFGLETIDRTGKRIQGIGQPPYDSDIIRVGQESKKALEAIFEGRQKLKKLQEATEFVNWCKDAKEDPDKIVSKISDDVIARFLDCIEPYFSYFLLDGLTIETESNMIENRNNNPNKKIADPEKDKEKEKNVKFNAKFALKRLEPFIKFTLLIDEIPGSSLSLIFVIKTDVNIKNARLYSAANSGSHNNGGSEGLRMEIEKIVIVLNLSFSRFVISHYLSNSIEMPISLGTREFVIERARLVLPQK
jgi:hypothetical protein